MSFYLYSFYFEYGFLQKYPTPRATPKKAAIKYGVGGLLLFIIIFIIWFPLVIFSFANTVYIANPPKECTVSVSLGGYQVISALLVSILFDEIRI